MPYDDFRQFLDALRQAGELVNVDRPVDLGDVGKALKKTYVQMGPALMFTDNGTKYPLVGGVYSTRSKSLIAFEATNETVMEKVNAGMDRRISPTLTAGPAPCQEVVTTGDEIDVTQFPIPTYSPMDGGAYITAGITVSKDPETGVPDIGHYRFMVVNKGLMSYLAIPHHRFAKNVAKCKRLGRRAPGALVIGVDPVLAYTCQVHVSDETNDWEVAGGLRGVPVELVKCKTVDIEVPATAEVVIEFEVDPESAYPEGPLGEHTGYYDAMALPQPGARITAITHRRNPIFQALLTGKPVTENHILKQIPYEVSLYKILKRQFPTIEQLSLRASSSVSFYIVIAMRPRWAGEARQAILATIASSLRPKWVTVVDPDIDVNDSAEVEWAISFRVQPKRDVMIIDQTPLGGCDPSVPNPDHKPIAQLMSSAVGIDATFPFGETFPDVADVPGWREYDLPELKIGK